MTGKELKKDWMKMPVECFETLTFGDLEPGDMFITLPMPGDNGGHGGFKGGAYIFKKLKRSINNKHMQSVMRLLDGAGLSFSHATLVLRVE